MRDTRLARLAVRLLLSALRSSSSCRWNCWRRCCSAGRAIAGEARCVKCWPSGQPGFLPTIALGTVDQCSFIVALVQRGRRRGPASIPRSACRAATWPVTVLVDLFYFVERIAALHPRIAGVYCGCV